jgi:hypothetical protein
MAARHSARTAFRSIIMVGVLPYLSLARSQNLSAQLLQLIFSSSTTTTLFIHPKSSDLLLLDSFKPTSSSCFHLDLYILDAALHP